MEESASEASALAAQAARLEQQLQVSLRRRGRALVGPPACDVHSSAVRGAVGGCWTGPSGQDWALPLPHLYWDWAHPLPHLYWDWAHPCHICTGIGLPPAHICTGTGPTPSHTCPHSCIPAAGRAAVTVAERTDRRFSTAEALLAVVAGGHAAAVGPSALHPLRRRGWVSPVSPRSCDAMRALHLRLA